MRPRQSSKNTITPAQEFIAQEFPKLGLYPHACSPLKFARAIESLRRAEGCEIELREHLTFDDGVFGMVCKEVGTEKYVILYYPHRNPLVLLRTQYHELMHIYRRHRLKEIRVPVDLSSHAALLPFGLSKGYIVTDEDDADAEQLGAAATLYTLGDYEGGLNTLDEEESAFGQFFGGPFRRFLGRA
jgi:hypothetical protein